MDAGSHILMGCIIATQTGSGITAFSGVTIGLASILPDLYFIPMAVKLGREHKRKFWIPHSRDWNDCHTKYPCWTAVSWDAPYSIFATILACTIIALIPHPLSWAWAVGYGLHVIVDYFTHSGEWANMPFFPLSRWKVPGLVSAWDWGLSNTILSWAVLGIILAALVIFDIRL